VAIFGAHLIEINGSQEPPKGFRDLLTVKASALGGLADGVGDKGNDKDSVV